MSVKRYAMKEQVLITINIFHASKFELEANKWEIYIKKTNINTWTNK